MPPPLRRRRPRRRVPRPRAVVLPRHVDQVRPVVRAQPLARERVHPLRRDGAVAVRLLVDERRVAEVGREERELVGALAGRLHADDEAALDERDARAPPRLGRDAVGAQAVDLRGERRARACRRRCSGRAMASTTRRSAPFGEVVRERARLARDLPLAHERSCSRLPLRRPRIAPHDARGVVARRCRTPASGTRGRGAAA